MKCATTLKLREYVIHERTDTTPGRYVYYYLLDDLICQNYPGFALRGFINEYRSETAYKVPISEEYMTFWEFQMFEELVDYKL